MTVRTRYQSQGARLQDYACHASNRTPHSAEAASENELIFVRRGAFTLWTHRRARMITANEFLFLPAGAEYSVSHPVGGGDECSILSGSALVDPLGRVPKRVAVRASPAAQFRRQILLYAATQGQGSRLEIEERLCALAGEAARLLHEQSVDPPKPVSRSQRLLVQRAQEILTTYVTQDLPLTTVADLAGISPFYLARLFRRTTGTTLHRYQNSLRLRMALERLLHGWTDIATLALDLGFCSHSHLTNAFRREFGVPPAQFRRLARADVPSPLP